MAYFKVKLGDQDKSWAPHTVCKTCVEYLWRWTKGVKTSLKLGIPMVWREPFYHATDCYFCAINTTGINRKNRQSLQYPNSICPPSSGSLRRHSCTSVHTASRQRRRGHHYR
ncbi:Uncharacterized protein FKW44_011784 [Caligus rogercresseyi]|uniref:Uncharacterized protein n=1 Tax=Caligus rogercresseyi TaxID=217165 RepID=A0A7T8HIE4_CALRO|nr:Uncharacterized protein FKW44_011784 [Caligus rogercresseyi]